MFKAVVRTLFIWQERSKTRAHLARLDAAALADIGLTAFEARKESEKPFWIA